MNKKLMRICASGTALAVTASVLSLSVYAAPAKYSAVEQGYITSVKNQGNWGILLGFFVNSHKRGFTDKGVSG